ncbi:hypothetical protein [Okeania sp. SIO2C2]|nr:hypothetical protein [Okeania sp. SIO2C2]
MAEKIRVREKEEGRRKKEKVDGDSNPNKLVNTPVDGGVSNSREKINY